MRGLVITVQHGDDWSDGGHHDLVRGQSDAVQRRADQCDEGRLAGAVVVDGDATFAYRTVDRVDPIDRAEPVDEFIEAERAVCSVDPQVCVHSDHLRGLLNDIYVCTVDHEERDAELRR